MASKKGKGKGASNNNDSGEASGAASTSKGGTAVKVNIYSENHFD